MEEHMDWGRNKLGSLPKITGTTSGIRIQKQSQFSNNWYDYQGLYAEKSQKNLF